MRTTLAIADDVLTAAKAMARSQGKTVGDIISDLARRSLQKPLGNVTRDGVPLLPVRSPGTVVTLDIVNALRDEA
ncbi:CopG family transcriptional regulator [Labrys neptuniae]